MQKDSALREHLLRLVSWNDAHPSFDAATAGLTPELRGATPSGCPHSPWRLVEHMRICQWDILEFCRNPDHVSPDFPGGYWPANAAPSDEAWDRSIQAFYDDLQAIRELVTDPATDLLRPIRHGDGQTILREILLLADHNAYHVGQLILVRRLLGTWPPAN